MVMGRRGPLLSPGLDATGGRSYLQASQTPGALGGRRAVQRWYTDGVITSVSGMIAISIGGVWRLVLTTARCRIAPSSASVNIDIQAKKPGFAYDSVLENALTVAIGQLEATGGVLKVNTAFPIGTLFRHTLVPPVSDGEDLTVELHYVVRAVSQ